jgi:hypothetical protein
LTNEGFSYGKWSVQYTPDDGGRIDMLSFDGSELLTASPAKFTPPRDDLGVYETRPVYGYDDCFPSVSQCLYPGYDWMVPDHGEVCWLPWRVRKRSNRLEFTVQSRKIPLLLKRDMHFSENSVRWIFEVHNQGPKSLPFQHVIHPLMPLDEISGMRLPEFMSVHDDIQQEAMDLRSPEEVQRYLMGRPDGTAHMIFLRGVRDGILGIDFHSGITLDMTFPRDLFPTIGIWWNNNGHPDETGISRNECAFEPVPGLNSSLKDAHRDGTCLFVPSGEMRSWEIEWKITK